MNVPPGKLTHSDDGSTSHADLRVAEQLDARGLDEYRIIVVEGESENRCRPLLAVAGPVGRGELAPSDRWQLVIPHGRGWRRGLEGKLLKGFMVPLPGLARLVSAHRECLGRRRSVAMQCRLRASVAACLKAMDDELERLLVEHLAEAFPASICKGTDYGEVDPVMIDADIYGWALSAAGIGLTETDVERLETALAALRRSLPDLPSAAQPYYERLLRLGEVAATPR